MEKNIIGVGLSAKDASIIIKALVDQVAALTAQNNDLAYLKKDCENLRRDLKDAQDNFENEHERRLDADRSVSCWEQDNSYLKGQIDKLREALEASRKENEGPLFARLDSNPEIQKVIQRCLQEKRDNADGSRTTEFKNQFNSKVQAIKEVRELGGGYQNGCGLKEAKDYVEARLGWDSQKPA